EGANFLHFQELLEEIKGIKVSYFKLYALLRKHGIISPKYHRITRKKHRQRLKQKVENKEKLTPAEQHYIAETNLQDPEKSHPRKPRAKYFGELLLMDASEHQWFGKSHAHLHLVMDGSSGSILGAYFVTQETLKGNSDMPAIGSGSILTRLPSPKQRAESKECSVPSKAGWLRNLGWQAYSISMRLMSS